MGEQLLAGNEQWRLLFGMPLGTWPTLLACGLLLLFCVRDAGDIAQRLRGRPRVLLLTTRVLTFLLGAALLLQPQWVGERAIKHEGALVMLMDTSASMAMPGSDGDRREEASRVLSAVLAAHPATAVYAFDSELRETGSEQLVGEYAADGEATRIIDALTEVAARAPRDLGAVVLVSDGADSAPEIPASNLTPLGLRVHTVLVGGDGPAADDAIVAVKADPVAFLRQQAEVEVNVRRSPAQAGAMRVSLTKDGELVAEVIANLDAAGRGTVVIPFDVDQLGRAVYTVSIPVEQGDAVPDNNQRSFLMQVTRDRLRALLVSGRPGWDAHFLRAFLKNRPSVDLITFFILRTASDMSMASPDELSLIPFPTDELFREHLSTFDVVIFQDFNYGPYQMARYLPRVRSYVQEGGAFAMIGGDLSFSAGGYAGTPIADVLPVELPEVPPLTDSTPFSPSIVPGMGSHPLVELVPNPTDNLALFGRLATVPGLNLLGAPRPGAQVLLAHPTLRTADGAPRPVLAVGEFERGRSLALAIDGSHRWGFATGGQTGDASAYERFWDRALRWLTRDSLLEPSRITTDRERYGAHAEAEIRVVARRPDYAPVGPAELPLQVLDQTGEVVATGHVEVGPDGRGKVSMALPSRPGAYVVVLSIDGEPAAEQAFLVEAGGSELAQPFPDAERLSEIAAATGGRSVRAADFDPTELPRESGKRVGVEGRKPLSSPVAFAVLCALLLSDWMLRRRHGLR